MTMTACTVPVSTLTATEAAALYRDHPDVVQRAGNIAPKLAASARRLTPSTVVSLARSLHPDLTLVEAFETMEARALGLAELLDEAHHAANRARLENILNPDRTVAAAVRRLHAVMAEIVSHESAFARIARRTADKAVRYREAGVPESEIHRLAAIEETGTSATLDKLGKSLESLRCEREALDDYLATRDPSKLPQGFTIEPKLTAG